MSNLLGTTKFCCMPLDKYQTKKFWRYIERVFNTLCNYLYEADYALEYVDVQKTYNNDGSVHYMSLRSVLKEYNPIDEDWVVLAHRIPSNEVMYIWRGNNAPRAWIYVMNPDGMQDKTLVLFIKKVSVPVEELRKLNV